MHDALRSFFYCISVLVVWISIGEPGSEKINRPSRTMGRVADVHQKEYDTGTVDIDSLAILFGGNFRCHIQGCADKALPVVRYINCETRNGHLKIALIAVAFHLR